MFITSNVIFLYESGLMPYIFFTTVDTDGLVLKNQAIRSNSTEGTPVHFQLFMG